MKLFDDLITISEIEDIGITGLTSELFAVYLSKLFHLTKRNILVVTSSLYEANQLSQALCNYTDAISLFPMDDFLASEALAISPDLMMTRLETLKELIQGSKRIVITNLMGYLRYLPLPRTFQEHILTYRVGDEIRPEELVEKLVSLGYHRETLVTKTGELGVRGFVIDVFAFDMVHPVRFEFFGDEIDSIRLFDEETQKSLQELKEITISPYHEFLLDQRVEVPSMRQKYLKQYSKQITNIGGYLEDVITVWKDFSSLKVSEEQILKDVLEYRTTKDQTFSSNYMFSLAELTPKHSIYYMSINNQEPNFPYPIIHYESKELLEFHENVELITKFLKEALKEQKRVILCLKPYQTRSFTKYISLPYVITDEENITPNHLNIINRDIDSGFQIGNTIVLTGRELFSRSVTKKKYQTNLKYATKLTDWEKLQIGDYVVHNVHGIGVYNGLKTISQGDIQKDYLEVLYQGKDKLYIPVEKIDLLSKYASKEGSLPKINRLGGSDWENTKARVRSRVKEIAVDLLNLYAKRELKRGFAFSPDTELQRQFEADFPYQETKDQLAAISKVKEEMESPMPMDLLLCGDVGYGKTEVAFRAIFKAVMDSKQVLYLCPTTILSEQQYQNALSRFASYPVNFALLNRFTTAKETKKVLEGLKEGTIDVVFGTHRLLSSDILPKDLGLLIIDEEQRFGVMHKEKIKSYKNNVDVLTLTATPIPRTLQMSLVGMRSLCLIETPPVNRYPVQTYVVEENYPLIKDAIYKELSRNGQVFLLFNRVERMEEKMQEIKRLVPEARMVFAHGKLSKEELESRMYQFVHHEYDVLVCTTIIETGIDIPNVNTLIILDADRFGLSQLYQIRGRVGRSDKIAYAYLMYQGNKVLGETALKRLNVIKEFTELGSGFSIATRDLSIRGAGDILGSEQAGFIDTIGMDLYLKILNEEVEKLKGTYHEEPEEEEQNHALLNVDTHISSDYVMDNDLKIEIHRKINEIDSLEKLEEVQKELEDRFGKVDENLLIYMREEWFETLAKKWEIIEVLKTRNSLSLVFSKRMSEEIDTEEMFVTACQITSMFRFATKGPCLNLILDVIKLEKHPVYYLTELLSQLKKRK